MHCCAPQVTSLFCIQLFEFDSYPSLMEWCFLSSLLKFLCRAVLTIVTLVAVFGRAVYETSIKPGFGFSFTWTRHPRLFWTIIATLSLLFLCSIALQDTCNVVDEKLVSEEAFRNDQPYAIGSLVQPVTLGQTTRVSLVPNSPLFDRHGWLSAHSGYVYGGFSKYPAQALVPTRPQAPMQQVLSRFGYMPYPGSTVVAQHAILPHHLSTTSCQQDIYLSTAFWVTLQTSSQVMAGASSPTSAVMLTVSPGPVVLNEVFWRYATASGTLTVTGLSVMYTVPTDVTDGGDVLRNYTRIAAGQPTSLLSTEDVLSSVESVPANELPDLIINNSNPLHHMPAALPSGNSSQPGGRATSALLLKTDLPFCTPNQTPAALPPGTTGQPGGEAISIKLCELPGNITSGEMA